MLDGAHESLLSDAAGLPAGPCAACGREVLAYRVPDAGDDRHACVHCDGPVRGVYLIAEHEIEELGYALSDPLLPRSGCATGCAAGGCATRGPG